MMMLVHVSVPPMSELLLYRLVVLVSSSCRASQSVFGCIITNYFVYRAECEEHMACRISGQA